MIPFVLFLPCCPFLTLGHSFVLFLSLIGLYFLQYQNIISMPFDDSDLRDFVFGGDMFVFTQYFGSYSNSSAG